MPQIGPAEILVILLVGLLVFGPKRLPEIGRQVGRGMRELRKFQETVKDELDGVMNFHDDDDVNPAPAPAPTNPYDAVDSVDTPAALPPATAALPATAPDPTPAAPRPASRAPSRFRAPGPRPTT